MIPRGWRHDRVVELRIQLRAEPGWSAVAVTAGRYLAYGILSLALLLYQGRAAWRLAREHWRAALAFAFTGNVGYYLLLVIGIQKIGAPVTDTIIGSIPVVVAVASNWRTSALPVTLSLAGLALINAVEFTGPHSTVAAPLGAKLLGLAAAVGAVALWTWYALANAAFLAGVALLGVAVSWGGTWLWNTASARLPTITAGILINIETVSGYIYIYIYIYIARGHWPPLGQLLSFALILAGVGLTVSRRPAPRTHPQRDCPPDRKPQPSRLPDPHSADGSRCGPAQPARARRSPSARPG